MAGYRSLTAIRSTGLISQRINPSNKSFNADSGFGYQGYQALEKMTILIHVGFNTIHPQYGIMIFAASWTTELYTDTIYTPGVRPERSNIHSFESIVFV